MQGGLGSVGEMKVRGAVISDLRRLSAHCI